MSEFEGMDDFEDMGDIVELDSADEILPDSKYWKVSKSTMQQVLKVILDISQSNADVVSKSVALWSEGHYLHYAATNKDIYLTGRVPLENDQNILDDYVVLNSKQLMSVVKYSSSVIIFKIDDKFYSSLMRGTQSLDSFSFSRDVFEFPKYKGSLSSPLPGPEMKVKFEFLRGLMSLATAVEDRKIVVKDGNAYGSYISVLAKAFIGIPDTVIKVSDMRDLTFLIPLFNLDIQMNVSNNRNYFISDNFSYSSLAVSGEVFQDADKVFNSEIESFMIDGNHIFNLFSFLNLQSTDNSVVSLESGEKGLSLVFKSKTSRESVFVISKQPSKPFEFIIQIGLTKKLLAILKIYPTLYLSYNDVGLIFEVDNLKVVQGVRKVKG